MGVVSLAHSIHFSQQKLSPTHSQHAVNTVEPDDTPMTSQKHKKAGGLRTQVQSLEQNELAAPIVAFRSNQESQSHASHPSQKGRYDYVSNQNANQNHAKSKSSGVSHPNSF